MNTDKKGFFSPVKPPHRSAMHFGFADPAPGRVLNPFLSVSIRGQKILPRPGYGSDPDPSQNDKGDHEGQQTNAQTLAELASPLVWFAASISPGLHWCQDDYFSLRVPWGVHPMDDLRWFQAS